MIDPLTALGDVVKLQEEEGSVVLRPMVDVIGLYGYLMKSRDGQPYYLVCDSGKLRIPREGPLEGTPIASVQYGLVTTANLQDYPIIIAWWGDPGISKWTSPRLTMYHPDKILTKHRECLNREETVQVISFPYYDGRHILGVERLSVWWREMRKKWTKIKEAEIERVKKQTRIEQFSQLEINSTSLPGSIPT